MIKKRAIIRKANLIGKVSKFVAPGKVYVKWIGIATVKAGKVDVQVLKAIPKKFKISRRSVEDVDDLVLIKLKGERGRVNA